MASFLQQGTRSSISGHLDQGAVIRLWDERHELLAPDTDTIVLSGIEYCDSAGVAFLLELTDFFAARGTSLKLVSASKQLKKFIMLYDLNDFFIEEAQQGE
ncbi:STAS domain-containing protein [Shewanella youngdeokensis]|uniref:STAS domain-containing protein n=1 Tax=Shewanella youngdeokensis TaxID=2999068 RepID=A0ABZ0JWJ6_9GAMM|nr:STAS domain-containing protein [Shewanella sp. DAU334]